jgi:hypothetical protein
MGMRDLFDGDFLVEDWPPVIVFGEHFSTGFKRNGPVDQVPTPSASFRVTHTNQDNQAGDPSKSFQGPWGHQQDDADYSTTTINSASKAHSGG